MQPLPHGAEAASVLDVPREHLQAAPLLVGHYYVREKRAVWVGRWGMKETDFSAAEGVTSAFEMESQTEVTLITPPQLPQGANEQQQQIDQVISSPQWHPAWGAAPLARSHAKTTRAVDEVSPIFLGYEVDRAMVSAMPYAAKYKGYFQIQVAKGKPQTVMEKDVELRFVHDALHPHQFVVTGIGENRFGIFTLHGTLDKHTNELRMYKVYKPKPKERRITPRRGRTTRTAAPVLPKKTEKPIQRSPVERPSLPTPAPTKLRIIHSPATSGPVHTPVAIDLTGSSSTNTNSRGRPERKRSVPAHLRDNNVIEHERFPGVLKKCYSILKGLMANPKAGPFLLPVDPVTLGIPDYFQVIKEPMDLGTIRSNLECGGYDDPFMMAEHVRLVFNNAMLYNAAHSQVHLFARKLLDDFEKRIAKFDIKPTSNKVLFKHGPFTKSKKEKRSDTLAGRSQAAKKPKSTSKSSSRRQSATSTDDQELIMSLKEDLERLKAKLEQIQQPSQHGKPTKPKSRRFRMEDLTNEDLIEPMTQAEKTRLSADIKSLSPDKINRVLEIIAETMPVAKLVNANDEIELDINAFDTKCLRMLEGYVREIGIGRKRKRPAHSRSKIAAPESRLKSAKMAALNIRSRKEELENQLAAIEGRPLTENADKESVNNTSRAPANGVSHTEQPNGISSDSDSSSSNSSDSDSDSDSESDDSDSDMETESSSVAQTQANSQSDTSKTIRDEVSCEPLRVENRGAWSMLAQQQRTTSTSVVREVIQAEESESSSLWMSARSMEQSKQQKLQQLERERTEVLEAQKRREYELREKEKQREREEIERRKQEQESALRQAQEERLREERTRESELQLASQRAKHLFSPGDGIEHDQTLTEDLESFSSSSFL